MEGSTSAHEKKKASESVDGLVSWVVDEIKRNVSEMPARPFYKSLFFKLVRGGNVTVVREVLGRLHSEGLQRELRWATTVGRARNDADERCLSRRRKAALGKCAGFALLLVAFVVTSPVFYATHAVLCRLDRRRRAKRPRDDCELRLFHALLSEEPDMVRLFLDHGSSLTDTDGEANNIYHHLAGMSAEDSQKAIRCHELLQSVCGDSETLKYAVTEQLNKMNYTAWEHAAKYGALQLCCHLASDRCGFGQRILSVSRDQLWAREPESRLRSKTSHGGAEAPTSPAGEFSIWEFNVSKYESGSAYGRQSFPLHLIVSRAVENLKKDDIMALLQSEFISKWMSEKISRYTVPCVTAHLISLAITVTLLSYVVLYRGDVNETPLYDGAWMKETYGGELYRISEAVLRQNKTLPTYNATSQQYEGDGLNTVESCLFKLHQLHVGHTKLLIDECHFQLANYWQGRCRQRCDCEISLSDIVSHLLPSEHREEADVTSKARLAMHVVIALCALQDLACRLVFLANSYNWLADGCWYASYPVLFGRMPGSYLNRQLAVLTYFLYAGAVLLSHLDLVAARRVAAETTAFFSAAWHVPGDSDGEDTGRNLRAHVDRLLFLFERQQRLADVFSKVILFGLLLRFLQAIYALRLVPGIGFFVITAKKMANHLAQFAVIFIIVLLAFGTIFHFIMRQVECPAKKAAGFQSLASSLFSAYQMSLGYGTPDFSLGVNARLAYVAFTVIATVLLLNLIIAVMTTTVEHMNQGPWKAMLNAFELWDEILDVEAAVLVFISPFKCFQKYYKSSRMTTFESVLWQNGKYCS